MNDLSEHLTLYAARKLGDHFAQIRRCVGLLTDEQLWRRANASSNSVANLLMHLRGNVSQWILGGLGGQRVQRDRQAEFDRREGLARSELLDPLAQTVDAAVGVIGRLTAAELAGTYTIQGYALSGVAAVLHVLEHFAFHIGQIVTTTKWLLDVDLSLYDERGRRRDGRIEAAP